MDKLEKYSTLNSYLIFIIFPEILYSKVRKFVQSSVNYHHGAQITHTVAHYCTDISISQTFRSWKNISFCCFLSIVRIGIIVLTMETLCNFPKHPTSWIIQRCMEGSKHPKDLWNSSWSLCKVWIIGGVPNLQESQKWINPRRRKG